MKTVIITYTHEGMKTARRAAKVMKAPEAEVVIYCHSRCAGEYETEVIPFEAVGRIIKDIFESADRILFICALAIAVRTIAPYLKSKVTDPAVLVADEGGRFLISVLSGHIGGANEWCSRLAAALDMLPVITTATDARGLFAVDLFAKEHSLRIVNPAMIKEISGRVLNGERVGITGADVYKAVICDTIKQYNNQLWLTDNNGRLAGYENRNQAEGDEAVNYNQGEGGYIEAGRYIEEGGCIEDEYIESGIQIVTEYNTEPAFKNTLRLVPMELAVGIGCRRGKSLEEIRRAVKNTFASNKLMMDSIAVIASVDKKADEQGIIMLARQLKVPYMTYSAESLSQAEGEFCTSEFVKKQVGVDNVCERSACLASRSGIKLVGRTVCDGVTVAVYS